MPHVRRQSIESDSGLALLAFEDASAARARSSDDDDDEYDDDVTTTKGVKEHEGRRDDGGDGETTTENLANEANGSAPAEARETTPGKGLPWSPRSSRGNGKAIESERGDARWGSDGGDDEETIAQYLGDEASDAATRVGEVDEKSVGKMRTSMSTWAVLVSYLRCCVQPETNAMESELEGVAQRRGEEEEAPRAGGGASCVPCASQPRCAFNESFTLHSGESFIGAVKLGERKPCLVLDLDETLVHSSFKPVSNPDYVVPVEIDGKMTDVHVLKRPWVDFFMQEIAKDWEIVLFTASLPKYADPVLDLLDTESAISWRLFRRHCYAFQGNYVKDLTCLGRDLKRTVIVDNSPYSYAFHPQNAFPISSFVDNQNDNELLNAIPYLQELARSDDVVKCLHRNRAFLPRQSYFSRKESVTPQLDRHGKRV